nr:MAG TPA: hypothetical protein [Bacteriophage sp.]
MVPVTFCNLVTPLQALDYNITLGGSNKLVILIVLVSINFCNVVIPVKSAHPSRLYAVEVIVILLL